MSNEDKRRREAYRRWYKANRAEHNARRRERYKKDAAYRKKQIENAAANRVQRTPVSSRPLMRELADGREIRVWRISQVAHKVKRSAQILRQWEQRGWLPDAGIDGQHRVYTDTQVELIKRLVKTMDRYKYKPVPKMMEAMDKTANYVFTHWDDD